MPGIARLITHFFPVSYSLVYYTLSMVVLIIAYFAMGKAEVRRIIALGFAYPIMLIQMALDVAIITVSAFVFDTNIAVYAIVTAVVAARVISAITVGYGGKFVQFDIITSSKEKREQITEYILKDVNRAVTTHVSRGEYTKEERRTISTICTPAESIKIKKYLAEVDPDAFATVMSLTNVWGKRFQDITEADNT